MALQRLALICALLAASGGAGGEVFKWVDKDGHVKYGDHPPADDPAAAQQVNGSNVPLALQDRLKSLDGGYGVLKISGNIDIAYVCLQFKTEDLYNSRDPAFITALQNAGLGTAKQIYRYNSGSSNNYNNSAYRQFDSSSTTAQRMRNAKPQNDHCPPNTATNDLQNGLTRTVYEIHFDEKAMNAYRNTK